MGGQTQNVFGTFVHITDDEGMHHAFGPGDPVPDWTRPLIGDHVIAANEFASDDPVPLDELIAQAPGYTAFGDDIEQGDAQAPTPPPISGPGSGRPAWAQFAESVGQPVTTGMSRQDIIDALIRNGHITE